jgi:hypothetical protein
MGTRLYICLVCGEERVENIPVLEYALGDVDMNERIDSEEQPAA